MRELWIIFGTILTGGYLARYGTEEFYVIAGIIMMIIGAINLWRYFDLSRAIADLIRTYREGRRK